MNDLVKITGLWKRYGALDVLKGVDLTVRRGERVALIGPSGSGKTTLLRCINFLERPTRGEILIDGVPFGVSGPAGNRVMLSDRQMAKDRAGIGFVFQRFNLFPHLSVRDNVTLAPRRVRRMTTRAADELAEKMLAEVGLSDKLNEFPDRLSGGQQQRVAIARVLAMEPKLILFDEPTSSLDPELVGEVLNVMRRLAEQGRTMIIVTHEIEFAGDVADRIIFMADGNIVEAGPPAAILQRPSHPRTAAFLRKLLHRN
jgi:ABC-type polar amino acid transport system ATPase subunit